jgi:hypothetical protein
MSTLDNLSSLNPENYSRNYYSSIESLIMGNVSDANLQWFQSYFCEGTSVVGLETLYGKCAL